MATVIKGRSRTFKADAATSAERLVKLSSGKIVVCAQDDANWVGVTEAEAFAADEFISVACRNLEGTVKCTAAGAITAGANVFVGASGKVAAAGGASPKQFGIAMEAAGADGDLIEVLPL